MMSGKFRRAFLQKRTYPFTSIVREEYRFLSLHFVLQSIGQSASCSYIDGALDVRQGIGRPTCELSRESHNLITKSVIRNNAVENPDPQRFCRVDLVAVHHQLHRLRSTNYLCE